MAGTAARLIALAGQVAALTAGRGVLMSDADSRRPAGIDGSSHTNRGRARLTARSHWAAAHAPPRRPTRGPSRPSRYRPGCT